MVSNAVSDFAAFFESNFRRRAASINALAGENVFTLKLRSLQTMIIAAAY